jgi:ABC-type transport system substrate-binding protein
VAPRTRRYSPKPPFNDMRVRQAMNYAVNWEEMHNTLYTGLGTLAASPTLVPR